MLAARLKQPGQPSKRAPWFANENLTPLPPGASVAIIGGGVAGASLAHELWNAGLAPIIIDPDGIAAGASGNPAGLIMPRIDAGDDAAARFSRAAYFHALRTIAALEAQCGERVFNPCGVLLHAGSADERERQAKIVAARLLPEDWIEARADGLFFPQAGVVDPVRYCQLLAGDASLVAHTALSVRPATDGVHITFRDRGPLRADAVIVANSADTLRFAAARTLPLTRVMGQIDFFPDAAAPAIAHVFGPYAAPAPAGGLVIGATYEPVGPEVGPYTTIAASDGNIKAVGSALEDLAATLSSGAARPRASIRCQTPDRLPVAGPAPDWNFYGDAYDDLRLGVKRDYPRGRIVPGVHLLTGLGSRGLVTAPLAAAAMVAEMTGALSPLEREIAEALHPARFFIRDLRRAKRILSK
jgi:tRNA 5-methylaminomethyl-2-thiouridine biosynthesis bifunctional protein